MRLDGGSVTRVTTFRISEAARLLGVSDDTLRRWIASGQLTAGTDDAGRAVVDGVDLANRQVDMNVQPFPCLRCIECLTQHRIP